MLGAFQEIATVVNAYGPVTALLAGLAIMNAFFVWRDYKREARQQKQLDQWQRVHNDTVIPLLMDCKEAIASSKEVIAQNSMIITGFMQHGR